MPKEAAKIQGIEFSISGGVSKSATDAVNNLSQALKDLRQMTGKGLNTKALTEEVKNFADAMKALKDASSIKLSDNLANNISTIAGAMKSIQTQDVHMLKQLGTALSSFSGAGKVSIDDKFSERINDVGAAASDLKPEHSQKLEAFGKALQTLNGAKVSISDKLAENLKKIADSMNEISDGAAEKLDQLATSLSKLKGVNLTGFSSAAKKASKDAKKAADKIEQMSEQANEQTGKKSKAGTGKSKDKTEEDTKVKTKNFQELMATYGESLEKVDLLRARITVLREELNKKISLGKINDKGVIDAISRIKELKAEITKRENSEGFQKLMAVHGESLKTIDLLRAKVTVLREELNRNIAMGKIDDESVINAISRIKELETEIKKLENRRNMGSLLKQAFEMPETNNFSEKFGWDLKQNIELIGRAYSSTVNPAAKLFVSILKSAVGTVFNIAKGIAQWSFRTAVNALKKVWNLMKEIARKAVEIAKNIPTAFAKITGISGLGDALKKIQQSIKGLGRVAFYRAIRSAIKEVTKAFEEGAERAYFYAKKYGDATKYIAESLDKLSSGSFKMSNQLGAVWATMLASIQPVLIEIINLVTRAAQVVTQFFAIMSGSDTYLKAKDYAHNWADETQKATKAAKEWKNQILGFDEINRLEEPTNSSSGKTDLYKDYENMFEEVKVESKFASFFKQIRRMLKSGEWGKLGKMLGEKFNGWINGFSWTTWGNKLGSKIAKAVDLAYSFLNTSDSITGMSMFKNLGSKLATFIDSISDKISFEKLGRTLTKVTTSLWDILYGAFTNPGSAGKLATNLSDFIIGALSELSDWIDSLEPAKIATALSDFFGKIKYEDIKNSFVTLIQKAWRLVIDTKDLFLQSETGQKLTQKLIDVFGDENGQVTWESVGKKIREKVSEAWTNAMALLDKIWPKEERDKFKQQILDALEAMGKEAGQALWNGIKKGFGSFGGWIWDDDSSPLTNWRQFLSFDREFSGTSGKIGEAIEREFSGTSGNVERAIETNINAPARLKLDDLTTMIKGAGKSAVPALVESLSGDTTSINTALGTGIVQPADNAVTAFLEKIGLIKTGYSEEMGEITQISGDAAKQTSDDYDSMSRSAKKLTDVTGTMIGKMKDFVDDVKKVFDESVFSGIGQNMVSGLQDGFTSLWDSFTSTVSRLVSNLVSSITSAIQTAFASMNANINTAISTAKTTLSSFASAARTKINSIVSESKTTLNNIVSSVRDTMNSIISQANSKLASIRVRKYATGGFPEDGLFYANHNELVGKFSNGKTAVANNEQITKGFYQAAFQAFSDAFAQTGGMERTVNVQPGPIYINGRKLMEVTYQDRREVDKSHGSSLINNFA